MAVDNHRPQDAEHPLEDLPAAESRPGSPPTPAAGRPGLMDLVESAFGEEADDPSVVIVAPPTTRHQSPRRNELPAEPLEVEAEPTIVKQAKAKAGSYKPRPWWHALGVVLIAGAAAAGGYLLIDKLASSLLGYSPAEALVMTLEPPVNAVDVAVRAQPSLPPEQRIERAAIPRAEASTDSGAATTLSSSSDSSATSQPEVEGFEHPTVIEVYEGPLDQPNGLFDRVRLISWKDTVDGAMVTIWGNGPARAEDIVLFRIDGEQPRELIKLRGIDLAFPRSTMEPDVDAISRIRTGFHPKPVANELHIVFDLTAPDIRLDRVQTDGSRIHLFLTRG